VVYGLSAANRLLDGKRPGMALQLSSSLGVADNQFRQTAKPIDTNQEEITSVVELINGDLVSAGKGGTLRWWKSNHFAGAPVISGHHHIQVMLPCWDNVVVTTGKDGILRFWVDGRNIKIIQTGQEEVQALTLGNKGELISAGKDGTVRSWSDPLQNPLENSIIAHTAHGRVTAMTSIQNGELVLGFKDGMLQYWSAGNLVAEIDNTAQGYVTYLAVAANGDLLSGGSDGSLRPWRDRMPLENIDQQENMGSVMSSSSGMRRLFPFLANHEFSQGEEPDLFQGNERQIVSIVELKNGSVLAGSADGTLRLYKDSKKLASPQIINSGHGKLVSLFRQKYGKLSGDNSEFVISGGTDGLIRRWVSAEPQAASQIVTDHGGQYISGIISFPGEKMISSGYDGTIHEWENKSNSGVPEVAETKSGGVMSLLRLSNDDFIVGSQDGSLQRWRGAKVVGRTVHTEQGNVLKLLELRNGIIASSGVDGSIKFWQDYEPARGYKVINTEQGMVLSMVELSNGELVTGGWDGTLKFWKATASVEPVRTVETGQSHVLSLIATNEGLLNEELLISGGRDGSLQHWHRSGRKWEPIAHEEPQITNQQSILSLVKLKDGEVLTGGYNGKIRRWKQGRPVGDGSQIDTGHENGITCLLVLPGGDLFSGGYDGSVRRLSLSEAVRAACQRTDLASLYSVSGIEPIVKTALEGCIKVGVDIRNASSPIPSG
jgi:WD40 repeat protein